MNADRRRPGAIPPHLTNVVHMADASRSYSVILAPEPEGGYSVHIPAFRGAHTQGETVEEALANAREVIELYAEILTERGEPLPPSDLAAAVSITMPLPAA